MMFQGGANLSEIPGRSTGWRDATALTCILGGTKIAVYVRGYVQQ